LNGEAFIYTASYTRVYASSTTYKVNIVSSEYVSPTTMWLLKNGTILAINYVALNYTGAAANAYYQSSRLFTAWGSELASGQQLATTYASSSFFHSTGTSSVTLGPSTFTVTNYAANSLPEAIPDCSGGTNTVTTFGMSVGAPSGSNYILPSYVNMGGSETTGAGLTTTYSITSQTTSVTVA
jgi:hypothetical protein